MKNIVIANSKGGSGKTTISLNLIQHLKPSYIIDADAHLGISNLMRLTETPTAVKVPKSKKDIVTWMKADKGLLVDCGGFDSDLTRAAIGEADVIITPTNDDPTEQFALMKFNDVLKVISKQKGKEVKAQVLLNRVHPSRREFNAIENLIDSLSNVELLPIVIPHSALIPKAAFRGEGVQSGNVAARFSSLAKLINKH